MWFYYKEEEEEEEKEKENEEEEEEEEEEKKKQRWLKERIFLIWPYCYNCNTESHKNVTVKLYQNCTQVTEVSQSTMQWTEQTLL